SDSFCKNNKVSVKWGQLQLQYEIIGKVICETDSLDDIALTSLVKALEKLVEDKDKLAQMIARKRAGSFSWNETLQDLLKAER
ncbi:MAG: hypothetical protein V4528_14965, partial [Pseudomonadota bacterium]